MHPWRRARALVHLTIRWESLPAELLGYTDHETSTIVLAKGMRQRQRRSVLAHELTHLARGPMPLCPVSHAKEERAVERETAESLITTDALIDALLWSHDEHDIADACWVDVHTVRDRLRLMSRQEKQHVESELNRRESTDCA